MDIYIDESGSFVCTEKPDAWSVVAAYVTYPSQRKKLSKLINILKVRCGKTVQDEIKLKHVSQPNLEWFLEKLSNMGGILFCTATDVSKMSQQIVESHRDAQANKVVEHIDKMQHESMRVSLNELSQNIKGLSPQLYVQLISQFTLINDIFNRATLYYSQVRPSALSSFKWLIDQKNTTKIIFEEAFEKMAPGILQSIALKEPFIELKEGNYSFMQNYNYDPSNTPSYLQEYYGIPEIKGDALNIGKILREDMQFVDSKDHFGVQIADLLVSTSRRLLRNEFEDNARIAKLLGSMMLSNIKDKSAISLISFIETDIENQNTINNINLIDRAAKPILHG
tara:strand:- start:13937 stop:14950 length:1014 start_codon:yes stop_codon:yes gene_type:complete